MLKHIKTAGKILLTMIVGAALVIKFTRVHWSGPTIVIVAVALFLVYRSVRQRQWQRLSPAKQQTQELIAQALKLTTKQRTAITRTYDVVLMVLVAFVLWLVIAWLCR